MPWVMNLWTTASSSMTSVSRFWTTSTRDTTQPSSPTDRPELVSPTPLRDTLKRDFSRCVFRISSSGKSQRTAKMVSPHQSGSHILKFTTRNCETWWILVKKKWRCNRQERLSSLMEWLPSSVSPIKRLRSYLSTERRCEWSVLMPWTRTVLAVTLSSPSTTKRQEEAKWSTLSLTSSTWQAQRDSLRQELQVRDSKKLITLIRAWPTWVLSSRLWPGTVRKNRTTSYHTGTHCWPIFFLSPSVATARHSW